MSPVDAPSANCRHRRATLRRKTVDVTGTIVRADGRIDDIDQQALLAPLEGALRALSWAAVTLAVTLALARLGPWP